MIFARILAAAIVLALPAQAEFFTACAVVPTAANLDYFTYYLER